MRAHVRVPATVANLGPGFDILALAIQLQNEVVADLSEGTGITVDPGEDAAAELRDPNRNLVARAFTSACGAAGRQPAGAVHLTCWNRIPFSRGLGSSAAATLGGILAANALVNLGWDEDRVIIHGASLEGHPDNVAASLLGGLVICASGTAAVTVPVPDHLRAVVFLPDLEMSTQVARRVVPETFSRADAIHNAGRCALLVAAMAGGRLELLAEAMRDRWHQPARSILMPHVPAVIEAALDAGAHGAALAGAGPSVVAICTGDTEPVEAAMTAAAGTLSVPGHAISHPVRTFGARVDLSP